MSYTPPPDLTSIQLLRAVVAESGRDLVAHFYNRLLEDDEARVFLSHSIVHDRLSSSLHRWLVSLLDEDDIRTSQALRDQQTVVGEVHARIKLPIHLVMQGAIVLKSRLAELLMATDASTADVVRAAQLAGTRIDLAIMLMSQVYVINSTARARLDEAYRLFSIDQDLSSEREVQRANLMEWSQKTLFFLLRDQGYAGLVYLANSPFGLWTRHRANFMFENAALFPTLLAEIDRIDSILLPQLMGPQDARARDKTLSALQTAIDQMAYLLSELFQTLAAMENGRDPLTRALNRRFLPAILGREVSFANENSIPLSIILIDIDHFKVINDQHGHQIGDLALRQVAQVVIDHVRPSDFVFRYGGEEFLVLLTETDLQGAQAIAERIRLALIASPIDTGTSDALGITASFGVAAHDGHPDQHYLIKMADKALYAAKANGRNRVQLAE